VRSSVEDAFESNFVGDANFLCEVVKDVFRENNAKRYSNSFAVVQSSGTGKSRLLDEMAKTIFAFPICVRADDLPGHLCTLVSRVLCLPSHTLSD
jgi:hypothetical protein